MRESSVRERVERLTKSKRKAGWMILWVGWMILRVGWMSFLLVGDLFLGGILILLGLLLELGFRSRFAKFFSLTSTVSSSFQVERSVHRGFVDDGGLLFLGLGLGDVAFLGVAAG